MSLLGWLVAQFEPQGLYRSWDYNRLNGRWCVRYPDGELSIRMCRDTATSYRNIFGGKIEKAS